MMWRIQVVLLLTFSAVSDAYGQDTDLLSLLGNDDVTEYATAAFKTNRVINLHSLESTAGGVLDFKINHRFGFINGGPYEFFGLDNAMMRLGFDYGITDQLTVGIGRSSFQKSFDGFLKYKILRQSTGKKVMPVTLAVLASSSLNSVKWADPTRDNYFSSRLFYTYQLIVGRKFSDRLSLQLSPTLVHRNLVATRAEKNDVYALGAAGRIKLTNRLAINAEYIYVLPDQLGPDYHNSLSLGVDIETGGHVFQLHFTNSTSMIEKGFITETVGQWEKGGIHFGFNVSRVFTIVDRTKHR
ncbi:MAG: hypothetical protein KDC59_00590 [Saprospiraceae bacterium]|nr:hypothetical protein [Saprospiraceae bacterium]HPG05406.1 DUF5777 family beta-barrel protein [Saprospiraceae bacterium]